jgi:hypothetical protein
LKERGRRKKKKKVSYGKIWMEVIGRSGFRWMWTKRTYRNSCRFACINVCM